jgi:hypothetical protein
MADLHNPGQNQDVNMPQERSQRKKKSTEVLHDSGQSIWLDNITRDLLLSGTLKNYVEQFSITGITSNPSIFDKAIRTSNAYDDSIRVGRLNGKSGDDLFFEIALQDIEDVRKIVESRGGSPPRARDRLWEISAKK